MMKYCPNCGTALADPEEIFCTECGGRLPKASAAPDPAQDARKRVVWRPPFLRTRKAAPKTSAPEKLPPKEQPLPEDGYDGYYDDILPADHAQIREGLDSELIKKAAAVSAGALLVTAGCIALMILI